MVRIAGVNLNNNKRVAIGLTAIYGIGPTLAKKVLAGSNIGDNPLVKDLNEADVEKIRTYIDKNLIVESDARLVVTRNIKRLKDISTYRGLRHAAGLPAHGQRTKTNARTRKGPRHTMGSGRKKAAAKT